MSRPTFQLYNTLTRSIEPLVPLDPAGKRVSLYVCGPTIYNYGHIGNFRTYIAVDLLRRALRHFGFEVDHVMQFTDVDDKTIRGAREQALPLKEFTGVFRRAFLEDAATLRIEIPARTPDATAHVPEMVALIQRLVEKKAAYLSEDGSVYFRIASFPHYGRLAHLDLENLVAGARVNQDEYEKEGVGDFVLWKKWTEADGEVGWDSPWGRGRPGWHIECSALSMETLGDQIDIHGGGTDLCFPHHENEIAQSESATGKPFVRHWFHVEHLLVDGQKMAKSLKNMFTVREVLERGFTGRELRYALLSGAHYRKNLNFTWQGIEDAKTAVARIDEWRKRLSDYVISVPPPKGVVAPPHLEQELSEMIDGALADDLNINEALGHLFVWIRTCHREIDGGSFTHGKAEAYLKAWTSLDSVLGLGESILSLPAAVQALLEQRADARKAKDFARSDVLRGQIEALRWKVKDTAKGQEVSPL